MITKASELLELFIQEESKKLEGIKMPHMPTLGSAYEELTKQGIDQAFSIPQNLDLKVASGFISIGEQILPEQIDCMLVHGDGNQYGLTDQYIYSIERVLCIFEVKKTLRKNDYLDAFNHLGKIRKKFAENFEYRLRQGTYEPDITVAKKRFSQITGDIAPERYMDIHYLSKGKAILFYSLVQESLAPVSIIHGYEGYKTENGLRTAFIDILEEKLKNGGEGLGIPSIPTLVTSNEFCLVKSNGIPFLVFGNRKVWVAVFSTRHNSARMILELIWSKISVYFDVSMPWNDDLYMESIKPLLIAEPVEVNNGAGWIYRPVELSEKNLKRRDDNIWNPQKLGEPEISALMIMIMEGGYLPLDADLEKYLNENHSANLKEVSENILSTQEFMRDGNYIRPINRSTIIFKNSDGTGYISSERERFDLWCKAKDIKPSYINLIFVEDDEIE